MSVPSFEEIKQALLIPEVKDDKWGRPITKDTLDPPGWTEIYKFRQDQEIRSTIRVRAGQKYD